MKQQFYECDHCGNMIAFVKDSGFPVICCDKEMHEVIPGAIDASTEKHNEKAEPFSQALHFELYTTSTCPNCLPIRIQAVQVVGFRVSHRCCAL